MEQTAYNLQKGRLDTMNHDFTDETWFGDRENVVEVS